MTRKDVVRGPLPIEGNLGGYVAFSADAAESDLCRLQRITDGVHYRGRLVAAVHHAVGALLVIPGAVSVPVGIFHKLLEGLRIALAEQIAGPLPPEIVSCRVAPGRTAVLLIARKKVEEEAGLIERPAPSTVGKNAAEQLLGPAPVQKMPLVWCPFIGIAR